MAEETETELVYTRDKRYGSCFLSQEVEILLKEVPSDGHREKSKAFEVTIYGGIIYTHMHMEDVIAELVEVFQRIEEN